MIRSLASALLWWIAAWCVGLAERVKPQAKRIVGELDGLRIVETPREQTFAPPAEWIDGLKLHAAFMRFHGEVRA